MRAFLFFLVAVIAPSPCDGFLNLPFTPQADPALLDYASAQTSATLKIRWDISQADVKTGQPLPSGHRLGIDGMVVELRGGEEAVYKHPNLPGADGPNPQLSSGAKALELLQEGKFVGHDGVELVGMDHGCWEMVWRRNANAGALICAFEVPEEVKRNEAVIPKGKLYATFPVWTDESLRTLRERKAVAEEKAKGATDRLKEAARKFEEERNPLMKALHFREACKAHEEIDYSGHRSYQKMPLDREMISLEGGLHLCSLGTVWTKKGGFMGEHVLLGSATVATADKRELREEKEAVAERPLKPVAYDGLSAFEWMPKDL